MTEILVLSGPNLDQLGVRSPDVYGHDTLEDHVNRVRRLAEADGHHVHHVQSNHEGDLIDAVRDARGYAGGIIANLGALSHTSWALRDAFDTYDGVAVEVHLSNPAAREPFRHVDVLASVVAGSIAGFGGLGYELAYRAVVAGLHADR